MDEQANDSVESVAEFNQSRLGGTAVSEALALPAPGIWDPTIGDAADEPTHTKHSKHKPTKHRPVSVLFAGLGIILIVLLAYIGIVSLKDYKENKATALTLANIKPDQFKEVAAQTFETASPSSVVDSQISKITHQSVVFTIGKENVSPSVADITSWLNITTDLTRNTNRIFVDDQAVSAYVTKLAASNTHAAVNATVFTRPDGSILNVSGGQQGETVGGVQAAAATIDQKILAGNGLNINMPASFTPFGSSSALPFNKLIEVDLVTKQMYVYQNGALVNNFPVSAGAPLTPTPVGTFHIYEKLTVQNMSGYNYNGTPYFQPNVPYVNYFDGADAIHGNYWRPASWFGNINSSHGCVGLQVASAEWVYNWAPIGTTVVTHD